MQQLISPRIRELESLGVYIAGALDILTPELQDRIAQDAAVPSIVTQPNAAIPSILNTYIDPRTIEVLFQPNQMAEIVGGEVQKGDWTTASTMFIQTESTGEVSSYGDFNQNGVAGVNVTFPDRQNYLYQTMLTLGDLESETYGLARVNLLNEKMRSAHLVLSKFQNLSYAFGINGLRNFGLLNDPSLVAPITPGTETVNGASVTTWAQKDAAGIYADIQMLFAELVSQMPGLIDANTRMTLAMSPESQAELTKTNMYNVNVIDQIKKNFSNLTIKTAVQYTTTSGNLVQLKAEDLEGTPTAECAYSIKLRTHRMVMETSSMHQKVSQGTYGSIVYRPLAIAQMLGV